MRSTFIVFDELGPRFDFTKVCKDFNCTVQNCLVNVGTDAGSDVLFPDRGTFLKSDAAKGRMVNSAWSAHTANFAALRTLSFAQKTEVESNPFKLQSFVLRCDKIVDQKADLSVQAICSDGTVVGKLAQL